MSQAKPRILVFEFHEETNTFNPIVASFKRFNPLNIFEGAECFQAHYDAHGTVCGIVDAINEAGGEVIPTVFMHASSGGRVDDAVLDFLCERLQYYVETAGEFDAVCAYLHGSTVCVTYEDACGHLLKHLRRLVGEKPIAIGVDLHANITDTVLQNADIICGYNTYPHVDLYQTGYRAASLCMEQLKRGKPLDIAHVPMKLLFPPSGYNSLEGSFRDLIEMAKKMVEDGRIRDFSIFPVQPWMDISDLISRVITIGEDPQQALQCADELAQAMCDLREDTIPSLYSVDEVIDIAEKNQSDQPILLAYAADSPNGGCVGDSPVVAMRIWERKSPILACMFVVDPDAVAHAFELGVGTKGDFSIGAGFTKGMPGPFCAQGIVKSLHSGFFRNSKKVGFYLGRTAVVSFGNMDIVLCEQGASSGSPYVFRGAGLEPSFYDLVVVKANTSFRASYRTISDQIYMVDAPGAGAPNLKTLPWENLSEGYFPFDFPEDYTPEKAKLK